MARGYIDMETARGHDRVQDVFHSFRRVQQAFYQKLLKAAQPHGITPVQILVLKALSERSPMRLTELAERMHLGNSTTSGIVDRLEKAGLIARERGQTDRRAVKLSLTEAGAAVWQRTDETRMELLRPLLQLQDSDVDAILRIHDHIIHILKTTGDDRPHATNDQ